MPTQAQAHAPNNDAKVWQSDSIENYTVSAVLRSIIAMVRDEVRADLVREEVMGERLGLDWVDWSDDGSDYR